MPKDPKDEPEEFSPEEAMRRFNAAMTIILSSPPISNERLKEAAREKGGPKPHEIPTAELERRAAYLEGRRDGAMEERKNPAAVALGKLGGKARSDAMSQDERVAQARKAAQTRWRGASEEGVASRWGEAGIEAMRQIDEALMMMAEGLPIEVACARSGADIKKVQNRIRQRDKAKRVGKWRAPARTEKGPQPSQEAEEAVAIIVELGFTIEEASAKTGARVSQIKRLLAWKASAGENLGMYAESKMRRKNNFRMAASKRMMGKNRGKRLRESE